MEDRKGIEKAFHNKVRNINGDERVADTRWTLKLESTIKNNPTWTNMKYYSIEWKSREIVLNWFDNNCKGKRVLDYCCGNGDDTFVISRKGAKEVVGIDISEISIKNCKENAKKENLANKVLFSTMDAEALKIEGGYFDVISEYGALHHLDLNKAYSEMARILKPDGRCICVEALGHNPIIHYYRTITPHLRTKWEAEHILRKQDIEMARNYFNKIEILGFFHLTTIAAVPFRNLPGFKMILNVLETVDSVLLKLPVLRWQAWQVVFVLSQPKNALVHSKEK